MSTIVNCSRRNFLKASLLAGGGLIVGVHIPGLNGSAKAAQQGISTFVPNAFLRIAKDGSVTVIGNHSEMGQGAYTSGAMTIAEELDADWTKIRVEPAPVDPAYNHPIYGVQITGGSTSTWSEWDRLRKAGAAARQMLLAAAAQTWNVDPSTCRIGNGQVIHTNSQRRLSYGELVEKAATLTPPQECHPERSQRLQNHRQGDQAIGHAGQDQRQSRFWIGCERARNVGRRRGTSASLRWPIEKL